MSVFFLRLHLHRAQARSLCSLSFCFVPLSIGRVKFSFALVTPQLGGLRVHVYTRIHLFFWLWESYWMRKWFCNFKPGPFPELSLYPTAPSGVQLPLTPFGLTLGKDLGLNHCKVLFTTTGPSALRWCYTRRFAKTIFSATQRCNIVATLFRIVTTLFQHCNAVLPWKSSLRIVPCNITFTVSNRGRRYSCEI